MDPVEALTFAAAHTRIVAARPPYDLAGLERFLTRVAARVRA
jgi:hypothetical protein